MGSFSISSKKFNMGNSSKPMASSNGSIVRPTKNEDKTYSHCTQTLKSGSYQETDIVDCKFAQEDILSGPVEDGGSGFNSLLEALKNNS